MARAPPRPPVAAPAPAPLDPEAEALRYSLISQCQIMKAQRIKEEAELAQFTEEKARLSTMWDAAKGDLSKAKEAYRLNEKERDDLAEAHAVKIKVYKQRIKHLLFEHQAEATDARTEGQVALKMAQEAHRESESHLRTDRRDLKAVLREMEVAHEEYLKALKLEHDRTITELRLEFERDTRELLAIYEDRMTRTREELTKAREEEIRAIEKRKSQHIATLVASHEKAFADIKRYYNEITHSNLDLIKNLKDEVEMLRGKETMHERTMFAIAQDNKKMSEPMRKAIEEVKRLREERIAYQRDLEDLAETKAHILVAQDKVENLRWEHEIVEQRYQRLVAERDDLYEKFQAALHDVKQKAGFKTLLLEKRLAAASTEAERQTVALSEVLGAAHLDPAVMGKVERQMGDVVSAKDAAIREMEAELARVAAKHDAMIDSFGHKLAEYGIPEEELGFVPLRSAEILGTAASATAATVTGRMARTMGISAASAAAQAGGASALSPTGGTRPSATGGGGLATRTTASTGAHGGGAAGGAGGGLYPSGSLLSMASMVADGIGASGRGRGGATLLAGASSSGLSAVKPRALGASKAAF